LGIITDGVADELAGSLDAEMSWNEAAGMLQDAATGKGNFGIGSATAEDANALGKAWVGDDATLSSDGRALISKNGLRQYRFPSYKPKLGKTQANLEQRGPGSTQWTSNAHIDILEKFPF
jgi:filamentous hemagglutinin